MSDGDLLDYAAAAKKLKLPQSWLRRNIKRLPHQKYGQHVRFGPEEIAEIQAIHRVRPADPAALPHVAPALLELRPGRAPRGRRTSAA
jgi:hypothetical protein